MKWSVIFDLDGVLVDSEPLWWQAGVDALGSVGVVLDHAWSHETKGMRTDDALGYWYRKFPWSGRTIDELAEDVNVRMVHVIRNQAQPLPGVLDAVELLLRRSIQIGVCSSAPLAVIDATLQALHLKDAICCVVSAHDEPMGKPHPAAYLRCAANMRASAQQCIAIEDSVYGAIAAKAAEMKVVAVQNGVDFASGLFDFCDARLSTLCDFDENLLGHLAEASALRRPGAY
jgi:mannitol-1-/sugar-/sorbitol-6-/2-deoxyglucose-6-phosphatase